MQRDIPGGAGKRLWGEGGLEYLAKAAATATATVNKNDIGWTDGRTDGCEL